MQQLLSYYAEVMPLIMSVVALVVVVLEWIALTLLQKVRSHKEGWVNIFSAALTYFPIFFLNMLFTISLMFWMYQYRLFNLGFDWYVWILAYIGYDFMSYIVHWLSHKVRFLWCIHSVHHSPKEMKTSVAFRGSFAEFLLAPHLIIWLPLLGFHPLLIIIVEGVGQLYGVPLHFSEHIWAGSKWHWLRKFFITPSIHRLHHAKNAIYIDTNYGLTLNLWDRLFCTYQHQVAAEKPVYGITKEINSENLLISQTDEFIALWRDIKNAPGWWNKAKYCFMPPGWNHVDGGETAKQLRKSQSLDSP